MSMSVSVNVLFWFCGCVSNNVLTSPEWCKVEASRVCRFFPPRYCWVSETSENYFHGRFC
jgi:hypothetical protein